MSDWSSEQYIKFVNERTQPAVDLINRINVDKPQKIIDIGCGPGNSTEVLARRFTGAYILGIDNSPNMIESAKKEHPNIEFMLCDASKDLNTLEHKFDIVFSNACIQWIPDHKRLLTNMMGLLNAGGALAVQMPMNFDEPIHKIIIEVTSSEKWASKFHIARSFYNLNENDYYDLFSDISKDFSIWKTTYFHTMKSHNDIIEWYRGTGLRPYLNMLSEDSKIIFEQDIYTEIVKAYPVQKNGDIIFRFPRIFFTAK